MKVNKLVLKNIRCFEELTIELNGQSAVLLGDNADGKSTILQSLAMGLVDDSSASALLRELYGETVRRGASNGEISVELENDNQKCNTRIKIFSGDHLELVEHKLYVNGDTASQDQSKFDWDAIFTAGYGPGVRVHGSRDYSGYLAVDALHPLFVHGLSLQNPELVMRRLAAKTDGHGLNELKLSMLTGFLTKILQLDSSDSIALNRQGIMINNGHGHYPLSAFGDGYQSVVTWVLDLLSWWFLQGSDDLTNVCGIVLIDEIEQHLHPRWQRNIVQLLTDNFPDVQFVITTHSPLVASGCENIPVHRLNDREHLVFKPFGWRAEEVYAMMGLDSSRAEGFVQRLEEFQQLDDLNLRGRQLSQVQQERFEYLYNELGQVPGPDPIRLMLQLKNLEQYARESAIEDA